MGCFSKSDRNTKLSMSNRIRALFQGFRGSAGTTERHDGPAGFSSGSHLRSDPKLPPTPPDENDQLKSFQPHIKQNTVSHTNSVRDSPSPNMTDARQIEVNGLTYSLANSLSISASPSSTFQSPVGSYMSRMASRPSAKQLKPFNTQDIKILLLENINVAAREILESQGYQVEFYKSSLSEGDLIEKIRLVNASEKSLFISTPQTLSITTAPRPCH